MELRRIAGARVVREDEKNGESAQAIECGDAGSSTDFSGPLSWCLARKRAQCAWSSFSQARMRAVAAPQWMFMTASVFQERSCLYHSKLHKPEHSSITFPYSGMNS